jgi:hypothetical protein
MRCAYVLVTSCRTPSFVLLGERAVLLLRTEYIERVVFALLVTAVGASLKRD